MADTIAEAVQQAAENITENANVKVPASPEGMFLAYSSLVIMALLPIFFGSKRSVHHQKEQKVAFKLNTQLSIANFHLKNFYRNHQKSPIS